MSLFDKAEDRSNPLNLTAIILHAPDGFLQRNTGRNGGRKDKDILVLNHDLGIVPEDHLSIDVLLRSCDINRVVGI